jgi:hypothetical protein
MRRLFAALLLLTLVAPAQASEVRNFFSPRVDGQPINACLAGGACGKAAADAFCKVEGFDQAMLFQRGRAESARAIDSDKLCDKDCTALKQVKCFTVRSDLESAKTAL